MDMESKGSEVFPMNGRSIAGVALGAIVVLMVLISGKDIARYIRLSTM
jgi:hypothetical protein